MKYAYHEFGFTKLMLTAIKKPSEVLKVWLQQVPVYLLTNFHLVALSSA